MESDCAVVTTFSDLRPFQGNAALLDWRLNGRLSQVAMAGRFEANLREVVMMPSEGRIYSKDILVFGLGRQKEFNESQLTLVTQFILDTLGRKRVQSFLVSFSELVHTHFEWRNSIRFLISRIQDYPTVDRVFLCESEERIKEAKRRHMDFGLNVDVSYES